MLSSCFQRTHSSQEKNGALADECRRTRQNKMGLRGGKQKLCSGEFGRSRRAVKLFSRICGLRRTHSCRTARKEQKRWRYCVPYCVVLKNGCWRKKSCPQRRERLVGGQAGLAWQRTWSDRGLFVPVDAIVEIQQVSLSRQARTRRGLLGSPLAVPC